MKELFKKKKNKTKQKKKQSLLELMGLNDSPIYLKKNYLELTIPHICSFHCCSLIRNVSTICIYQIGLRHTASTPIKSEKQR